MKKTCTSTKGSCDILGLTVEEHDIALQAIEKFREQKKKEEAIEQTEAEIIRSITKLKNLITFSDFELFLDDILEQYDLRVCNL